MTDQDVQTAEEQRPPEPPAEDDGPEAMLADDGQAETAASEQPDSAAATDGEIHSAGEGADETTASGDGEEPVSRTEDEPESVAAEPVAAQPPAEIEYPTWWRDPAEAERERAAPAAPDRESTPAAGEPRERALDDAARERLEVALCGPLPADATQDVRAQRREAVNVLEETVFEAIDRAIGERAADYALNRPPLPAAQV